MSHPYNEKIKRAGQAMKLGMRIINSESLALSPHGRFIFHMEDAQTGEVLSHWEQDNIITRDAGILAARLYRDRNRDYLPPQHHLD